MSAPGPRPVAHRRNNGCSALRQKGCGLWLLLSLGLTSPVWAGATATRIDLMVLGMDCSLCVQGLEQRLKSLPGAQQVQLELERGRLSLLFRAGSTVSDETLRTLMGNAGFVVRQIRRRTVAP